MERKTKIALIVIVCIILAVVILAVVYFGDSKLSVGKKNYAKDYILGELDGETMECTIEEDVHFCHLIYKEDERKIGDIWIYYHPGGVEPYKPYTFTGTADKMIVSDKVIIFIAGTGDFLSKACDLYNEEFGFNCILFQRPER